MQKRHFGVFFAYIGVILVCMEGIICEAKSENDEVSVEQTYVVSQDGTADFMTIQEAVDASCSGDTIRIMPGTYYESVKIYRKSVTLEGTQRESCIIEYMGDSYDNPPLDMSAGTVRNLTIHSLPTDRVTHELGQAYAVHIDKEQQGSKIVLFQNCSIISETSACFGIGLWGQQHVYIEDCELISKSYTPNIYVHDVEFPPYGGEAYFSMNRCVLRRETYGYVLLAHAILPENTVYMTFREIQDVYKEDAGNPKICIENKYEADGIGWCGLNNVFLMKESSGNSINEMNYVLKEDVPMLDDNCKTISTIQ